jgi:streptogramin lyase
MNMRGLALAPDGTLYLADGTANQLVHLDTNGNSLGQWASPGSGDGQFTVGEIAVGPDGTVYNCDGSNQSIQRFSPNGEFLGKWGLSSPAVIAVDPAGKVFASTYTPGGGSWLAEFNPSGSYLGGLSGYFAEPSGVAFTPSGEIYVADYVGTIFSFTSAGIFICTWTTNPDFGLRPIDVGVDSQGAAYPLGFTPLGSTVIRFGNGPVPTKTETWGSLKAMYR